MKREIDLTPYIPAIMEAAEKTNKRDFLMLAMIGEGAGFRRGEVVGNNDRRRFWPIELFTHAKKKSMIAEREKILSALTNGYDKVEAEDGDYRLVRDGQYVLLMRNHDPLPGLQIQDLHDGAIWVEGKGGTLREHPLPKWLYEELTIFNGKRKTGKVFDYSASSLYKLTKKYAKMAGLPADEANKVHPHRFRAYYIKSIWRKTKDQSLTQDLARHATWDMSKHYIGESDPDEKRAAVESLFAEAR